MKNTKDKLISSIALIENKYPSDDIILSYGDFLKHRRCIKYYQFNPIVLQNLARLTDENWTTSKRINRLSLLEAIKKYIMVAFSSKPSQNNIRYFSYYNFRNENLNLINPKTSSYLFSIFRKVFELKKHLPSNQWDVAQSISSIFMKNIQLSTSEQEWFCNHVQYSDKVLNRVLRYTSPSTIISTWALNNYDNSTLRNRRAELTSWVLDNNHDFVVSKETLLQDYYYQNKLDNKAIHDYIEETNLNLHIQDELKDVLPLKKVRINEFEDFYDEKEILEGLNEPVLNFSSRFYTVPTLYDSQLNLSVPDFEKMEATFYDNLHITQDITMVWSIGYSRLSEELKTEMLKKYYSDHSYSSLIKVAEKFGLISILKWMLDQK